MAKQIKMDQNNETQVYDSHIIHELVKYVDGKPERLQYLRQCVIPFFDVLFFSENVEGGADLIRQIIIGQEDKTDV